MGLHFGFEDAPSALCRLITTISLDPSDGTWIKRCGNVDSWIFSNGWYLPGTPYYDERLEKLTSLTINYIISLLEEQKRKFLIGTESFFETLDGYISFFRKYQEIDKLINVKTGENRMAKDKEIKKPIKEEANKVEKPKKVKNKTVKKLTKKTDKKVAIVKKAEKPKIKPLKRSKAKAKPIVKTVVKNPKVKHKVKTTAKKQPLNKKLANVVQSFGGVSKFARLVGYSQGAISRVLYEDYKPSHKMAIAIEKLTKGEYTYKQIRGVKNSNFKDIEIAPAVPGKRIVVTKGGSVRYVKA